MNLRYIPAFHTGRRSRCRLTASVGKDGRFPSWTVVAASWHCYHGNICSFSIVKFAVAGSVEKPRLVGFGYGSEEKKEIGAR